MLLLMNFMIEKLPMKLLNLAFVSVLALFTILPLQAQTMSEPEKVVRDTVNSVVENIQTNRDLYRKDTEKLHQMIETTLVPVLHLPRMANLILGRETSRSATPQQKKDFAAAFKTSVIRTYAPLLLDFTGNDKVIFEPAQLADGADKVTVKAQLVAASGDSFPISLFMSNRKDTRWRAYNMEVAGINFISTYRLTYGSIISQKGLDGLIDDLNSKNAR